MVSKPSFILLWFIFTVCHSLHNLWAPSLKINHVEKCSEDNKKYVDVNFVLNNEDSDGWKSLDLDIDFIQPCKDYYYTMVVHKMNNGDWSRDIYSYEGELCEVMKKFVKRVFDKLGNETEPKIMDMCNIEKGKYSVKNFMVPKDAIDIPPLLGTLQVVVNIMDKNKENIVCGKVIAEYTA